MIDYYDGYQADVDDIGITAREVMRFINESYSVYDGLEDLEGIHLFNAKREEARRRYLRKAAERRRKEHKERARELKKIAVNAADLADLLSICENSARKVGKLANAEIWLNGREVLYNVEKVKKFIDGYSGTGKNVFE